MSTVKKIDAKSSSSCHNALSFFSVPPTQVAINRTSLKELLPISSTSESPYEFRVFSDSQFVDLSKTYLYIKASVQKEQNNQWVPVLATDPVSLVNNFGSSFIKQLKVSINGQEIYDSSNLYPYLAYLKQELNFSNDYKDNYLSASGYYRDDVDQNNEANSGHVKRMALASEGRTFETFTKVDFDLANQEKLLLNNLDLLFSYYQSDNRFLIKSFNNADLNNYRIFVHSIKMYVRCVDVQPSVNVSLSKMLEREPAKYSGRKLLIRSSYLSEGRTEVTQNVFSNIVPRRLICALVDNQAYVGSLRRSPFNFRPFGLREISVNAGGTHEPLIPYNCNFSNPNDLTMMRMFTQLHETCELGPYNTNGISLEKFKQGWSIFVMPLNSTLSDCDAFELIREGTTTIRLQFDTPLAEAVTLLTIGEFDSMLMIDRNRIAVSDGQV